MAGHESGPGHQNVILPMSTFIHPPELHMTDTEGNPLVSSRNQDSFRYKPAWAVYKVRAGLVEARSSDFTDLATAKTAADALNRNRGEIYYFRVYRLGTAKYIRAQ